MIGGSTGIPRRQFGRFDNVYVSLFAEGIASAAEAGLRAIEGGFGCKQPKKGGGNCVVHVLTGQSVLEADLVRYGCLLGRKISAQ